MISSLPQSRQIGIQIEIEIGIGIGFINSISISIPISISIGLEAGLVELPDGSQRIAEIPSASRAMISC